MGNVSMTPREKMDMAEEVMARVFRVALEKGVCLEVAVWIADGNVVIEEGGKLNFLTASEAVLRMQYANRRRGIG